MAAISYDITFEDRETYLVACVKAAEISFEMVIEYTNLIAGRMKKGGYRRLMLVSETPVLGSTDCYEIASYILRNAIRGPLRIAVLDADPANASCQRQISAVSRKVGVDVRSFDSTDPANEWLLGEPNGKGKTA